MRLILRATFAIAVALFTVPVLTTAAIGDDTGAGIALATPTGASSLSAPIVGAPGTTDDRLEDVVLVGPGSVGALTMTVERTRTSALDQGPALQYSVERCDTAWVSSGKTTTCPTTPQVLRAPAPLGPRADEIALGGVGAGATAHLRVRFVIAKDAPRAAIGQSSTLEFRITASL
jgi:hypothetical protein